MKLFDLIKTLMGADASEAAAAFSHLHNLATDLHESRKAAATSGDEKRLAALPDPGAPFSHEEQQAFAAFLERLNPPVQAEGPLLEPVPESHAETQEQVDAANAEIELTTNANGETAKDETWVDRPQVIVTDPAPAVEALSDPGS